MNRSIGLIGLTFVAVSGVIGSGWLFAPLPPCSSRHRADTVTATTAYWRPTRACVRS